MLTFSEKVINLQFKYLLDFIAVKSRPHERQKDTFFKEKMLFFWKAAFLRKSYIFKKLAFLKVNNESWGQKMTGSLLVA